MAGIGTPAAQAGSIVNVGSIRALAVEIVDSNGAQITSFGASTVDGSTFTQNSTAGGISMGVYVASPQTLTTGKSGAIAVDINRNTMVNNVAIKGVATSTGAGGVDTGTQRVVLTWDGSSTVTPVDTNGNKFINGAYTSASTVPGAAQDVPLAQYNSSAPTITNANFTMLQTDVNANLKETLGTLIAGENLTTNRLNVEPVYSYTNMTTGTTTTIKSGAGTLHSIVVNTPVASATIKIYDNTAGSGTLIGTITCGGTLASDQISDYMYDVSFATGLTIVTSGATDITICYR